MRTRFESIHPSTASAASTFRGVAKDLALRARVERSGKGVAQTGSGRSRGNLVSDACPRAAIFALMNSNCRLRSVRMLCAVLCFSGLAAQDFGSKEQPVPLPAPEKWCDTETVAAV